MSKQLKISDDAQLTIGAELAPNGSNEELKSKQELISQYKLRINFARDGGNVKRFHAKQIIGEQTNGHHQYNMLSLLFILNTEPSMNLIKYVLWHDTAEHVFGDMPSTVGSHDPELYERYGKVQEEMLENIKQCSLSFLDAEEQYWFECLDKLEVYLFAKEQLNLGNKNMTGVIKSVIFWFSAREPYTIPDEVLDVLANWDEFHVEE